MIEVSNVSAMMAAKNDSRRSRQARGLSLSVAAVMLAGTALVPAKAQTFDIGGALVVTDFTGPPLNNPTVITNGDLTVDAGSDLSFGGLLNDSLGIFSLIKTGAGALTLSGANTYTGGTELQAGSLIAGVNGAFGTGALSVTGNSTLSSSGANRTIANAIGIGAGTTLSVSSAAGQTMILSGSISGTGVLRKTDAGTTVRLTGNNSYSGGTELAGGTLAAGNDAALGTGGVSVTANSTLTSFGANRTIANVINIDAGVALSLTSATNQVLTLNGVISGDGELRKGGSNAIVRLNGVNTYTGGTALLGGRVEIGNASAFSSGDITTLGPNASTIAMVDPNGSMALTNAINLTGASLSVEAPADGHVLQLLGNITGAASRTFTVSGTGAGTVLLSGNNAIAANVNVNSGWLGVGSATALNGAGRLIFADAAQGLAFYAPDLTVSRRINNNNVPAQIDIDTGGFNATLSGIVQDNVNGTLGLTKVGAGILTLSNPATDLADRNILGGGAQVDAGTLNIVTGALRANVTVNNGATLAGTGSVVNGATVINSGGTLSPGNALVADSVGTLTFAGLTTNAGSIINFNLGAPAGPNDLVVVNGDLSLSGTLNLAGLPGFGAGVYTLFTHTGALTNNLMLGAVPATTFNYALLATGNALTLNVSQDLYWDGVGPFANGVVDGGTGNWTGAGTNWTDVTGTLQVAYVDDVSTRAFFQGAPGTVTLGQSFIFSELHFLSDGYVINPSVAQGFDSLAAFINVADGATATINAAIASDGGLTKVGNGTLNLGAENTFLGTFLNAGRINISTNGGLGADQVTMAAGTTLGSYGGQVTVANAFAIAGGVTFAADTLLRLDGAIGGTGGFTKIGAADLSLGGANNFTGNVDVNAGSITLFNSAALGDAGNVLNLADGTALGLGSGVSIANAVALAGAATINQPMGGTATLAGVVSGAGPLTLAPTGTLILSGANSYSGGTTITSGTIGIANNNAFGTGDVAIDGAATLAPQGAIQTVRTLANNFAINAATTINGTGGTAGPPFGFAGNVLELNGNLTGNGNLQVVGGAALTLGGSNGAYTGNLIVGDGVAANGARLRVASADALGTGTITLNRVSLLANFTGGTITINNNIFVDGNGFEFAGLTGATADDDIIVNGNIVGTGVGSFNKLGAITVTLNGTNNYNQLFIDGGGVVAGNDTALGNGEVINTEFGGSATIAAGADGLEFANNIFSLKALVLDTAAFTMTLNGNLNSNAAHAVDKNGAGTLILNGSNGFSGDLSVNGGTVVAGSDQALGTGGILMADATTLRRGGAGNRAVNNGVQVTGTVTFDANGESLFINAPVSGAGALNIVNTGGNGLAGVVALGNVNTYTGGTVVDDATVFVTADSGLGDAAGGLTLRNAQLSTNASFTSGRNVLLDGVFGQVAAFNNAVVTLDGVVSGSQLRITEGGTVVLNGVNTYTGGTDVTGTVQLGNNAAAGTGAITLNAATLALGSSFTLANNVILNGDSTIATNSQFVGLDGVVSGTGGFAITTTAGAPFGGGVVLANAGNSFTGNVSIGANAILGITSDAALGDANNQLAINEGLLVAGGNFATDRAINLGGSFGQIDVNGADVITVNGLISGSQLRKGGNGTLVVTNGGNSFTDGAAIFGGGTLVVGASGALGGGFVNLIDGTLASVGAGVVTLGNAVNIGGAGTVITIANAADTLEINGALSGADNFTKTGDGILRLNGVGGYSGDIQLTAGEIDLEGSIAGGINAANGTRVTGSGSAGGTTVIADGATLSPGNSPGALNFASLVLNNGTFLDFELAGLGGVPGIDADLITVTNDLTLDGILNITGLPGFNVGAGNRTILTYGNLVADNGLTIATAAPVDVTYSILAGPVGAGAGIVQLNVAFGGIYRWDGGNLVPNGVIDGGAGTLNLVNTNFTNSDGTFNLAYGNNATDDIEFGGVAGGVDVADAINFDQMNFVATGYTLGGVGSLNANNSAINLGANDATILTAIIGGPLAKNGSGTLTLAGNSSYASLALNEGTVVVGSNTALGGGLVTMANATTLANNADNLVVANDFNIGNVTVATGANTFTMAGTVNGAGLLTKTGSGNLVLNGANGFTGGTALTEGTVTVGTSTALGTGQLTMADATFLVAGADALALANGVTTQGVGTVDTGAFTLTLDGVVDGAGSIVKVGSGNLVLNNANTYSGGSNITAGTVTVGNNSALGTNAVIMADGTTLANNANNLVVANNFTVGAVTVATGANTFTMTGAIDGNGPVTKTGAGTLVLTGTNTYAGGTFLNEGTLQIDDGNAIGAGTLTTTAGTTLIAGLAINTPTLTLANNIVLGAGGNTTINLLGSNYGVNVTTGALSTNGTPLVLNGVISGDGGIDTLGFLANGGGSIAFNSTNSYTGGTNLGSVIALIGADGALGTGGVNLNAFGAGIQNTALGTTRTLANDINVNDAQHSVGGAGNLVLAGAIGGNGDLFKVNDGTVNFTGAGSTYGGIFAVNDGTVLINGSFVNAAANVVVAGGATLGGSGSIAGSVSLADGANLNPGNSPGTMTVGNLSLSNLTNVNFELGAANTLGGLNDRVIVTGNLVLDGLLNVTETVGGTFGLGIYNLFSYGTLTDNGLTINGVLPNALTGSIQHNATAQQINLIVAGPDSVTLNWDGTDFTGQAPGAPLGQGGSGVWNTANTNWTGEAPGEVNATWQPNAVGIFGTVGGTVDVASDFTFAGLAFQADGYTLANAGGSLSTNGATGSFISVDPALTATINATITGTGVLMKQGAGTLVLGGTNTNSGGVNLMNGTLAVTSDAALGTGVLTFTGGTTLRTDTNVSIANAMVLSGTSTIDTLGNAPTLNGVISGTGLLFKTGAGNLTLNAANSYTGGTTLNAGSITVGNNGALGAGAVTMADATSLIAGVDGLTIANAITTQGGGTIDTGAFGFTLSGVIDGAGSLTKIGAGNLTLTNANSYAGGTNLNVGTVTVTNSQALGTGTLAMADATSLIAGANGLNLANAVTTAGVGTVDTGANTLTLSGVVSGAGSISKTGSGNLILTGTNLYSGGTALTAGTITVTNNASIGTGQLTMSDATTLAAGAADIALANGITTLGVGTIDTAAFTFTLNGVVDGAGSVAKVGIGNLVLNGANSYAGGTTLNSGTITVGNNAALGTGVLTAANGTSLVAGIDGLNVANAVTLNGGLTVDSGAGSFQLSGVVDGAGSITKVNAGNLILTGVNGYTGGTNLNAGSITVTNNASIGTGTLTAADGTTLFNGVAAGAGAVTLANAVVLNGGLTINLQGTVGSVNADGSLNSTGNMLTLAGAITGTGSLNAVGGASLFLNGANDYSGGTTLNQVAAFAGTDTAFGSGSIAATNAVIGNNSGATRTLANDISIAAASGLGIVGTNDLVLNGVISGDGVLGKFGVQTLTLNGANTFTGGVGLLAGTIVVGNNAALGTGIFDVTNLGFTTTLQAGVDGLTIANAVDLDAPANLVVDTQAFTFTMGGEISSDGTITKVGAGNLILTGTNLYSGGTALTEGTLTVTNNASIGTGQLTMSDGATLAAGAADVALANGITTNGVGTIDTQAFTFTLNGVIDGAGSIVKTGTGNLVLNGANTFAGGSSLTAGTVTIGNNTALGTGAVSIDGAVTLLSGIDNLAIANNVVLNNGVTLDTAAFTTTYSGVISGAAGITKVGSGNLILTGDNSYAGGTALTAGSITFTTDTAFGTGTITTTGGTTLVAGLNDPSNGVLLNVANAIVLGAGTTFLDLQGSTGPGFFGDGTVSFNGTDLVLGGVISGTGALNISDSGRVTLNGDNSYSGGTTVSSAVVLVGSDTALGTGAVTVAGSNGMILGNSSGALRTLANDFNLNSFLVVTGPNDITLNGVISGAQNVSKASTSTLTLNGVNTHSSFTSIFGGRITVGNNSALGTSTFNVFSTGQTTTLAAGSDGLALANNVFLDTGSNLIVESGAGSFTLGGVIAGNGVLSKIQDGTLVLNGSNSFAGGTSLNVGTIQVGTSTALGTGGLVMADSTTLQAGAADLVVANAITTNGLGTVDTQGFTFTLNGVVDGAGSISKIGAGNLVLNGANSFAGGSFINAGTVTVGSNTALGTGAVFMLDGTTLATNTDGLALANEFNIGNVTVATGGFSFTLNGPIGGSGLLTKTGSGNLVLNGSNAYGGGTALTAGTITIGADSALGTGQLTMADSTFLVAGVDGLTVANGITTLGVGTVNTGANTLTLSGVIDGAGSLTKVSGGNLILSGVNSYTGGTNLNAGSLTVTNNASIGTGTLTTTGGTTLIVGTGVGANTAITLANAVSLGAGTTTINLQGTSLTFNNDGSVPTDGASLTLNGVVSGAGGLATGTFGTLTLNGANSYAGGTLINTRSVVYVGSDTAVGTGTVTMGAATGLYNNSGAVRTLANNFVLNGGSWLGGSSNLVLNGGITGAGTLIKAGAASLVLNGDNSGFTGNSQLRDGRITVSTSTALGTGGTLTVFAPVAAPAAGLATTLAAGADALALANNVVLSTASNLIVESGMGSFTLNGVISGDGALTKVQGGTLVLNGVNTFTGGTALNVGTITVGTGSALGTGTLAMAGGTTLNAGGSVVLANAITTAGVGTFNTDTGLTLTLNGIVSGAGSIAKTGAGLLILNGANSYSGGTALNAGTIRVGNDSALGTGDVAAAPGTTLQAGGTVALANNIAMAGGMTVDNFGNLLTLGGVLSGTGPLSVIDSTGSTGGVLTLAGVNSYTGGTVVTGTTVSVSQDANLGNVAGGVTLIGGTLRTTASFATDRGIVLGEGGGTLSVATDTVLTVNGVISGTRLTKNGGELVLTAANTYAGGTALNAGTITVANNAALGTGALDMADGTTLNTATNLGTTPTSSTVTLANAITTAGVGTINTNSGLTLVANGVVSGAGSINKTGTGLLVLNGANSYTGGTTLAAGTIRTGTSTALGTGQLATTAGTTLQAGAAGLTVANAIALGTGTTTVDTQAFTYTLSGVASGMGGISKIGSGVLNLSGASTYTGATTVAAGTLNVTGSLVSAVTVNSGAAITGTGTVGALSVLAGASVNPGTNGTTNTATLTVTGAATLAGTYTANITPSSNDRISAGGALTLGGTLAVVPGTSPIFSQFNQTFTVASGASRTGTFAAVTGMDQFGIAFAPTMVYTATQANIRLAPQSLVVLGNRFGGISGNALEVAQAFDRAVAAGYNPQAFFNVYANAGSNLPTTLRQMSGEQRATERRVVLDTNRVFRESALDRLNGGLTSLGGQQVSTSDGDRSITFWLRGAGSWSKAQTSGAATGFTTEQRGILTGLDWAKGGLTVGAMFHYTSTDVEYRTLGGTSNVETVGGTAYAGYRQDGGLVLNGGVSVAGARTSGNRAITMPSFSQTLAGVTRGTTYQFFGEFAWDLAAAADTRIEPFARFTYVRADMGALAETGGVAALSALKQNYDLAVTNVGARFGANVADGKVGLNASVSYQHTGDDRDAATIIGIPAVGQNGLIRSVAMDRDSLSLQADATVNLSDTIRFSLGYSGLIGKRNDDHGGRATLNFAF